MSVTVAAALKEDGKTLEERLQPTLREAEREMVNADKTESAVERKLKVVRVMHNVSALGLIINAGSALWKGRLLESPGGAMLAALALGVLMLLLTFYDDQVYKSGEPMTSIWRAHSLKSFIRDVEMFISKHDRRVVAGPEMEAAVAECEWRFGLIMGTTFKAPLEGLPEAEDRWARWRVDAGVAAGKGVSESETSVA